MTISREGFSVIAGPCAAESREQMLETARAAANGGAAMLRAGAWKPRSSPRSFQGPVSYTHLTLPTTPYV